MHTAVLLVSSQQSIAWQRAVFLMMKFRNSTSLLESHKVLLWDNIDSWRRSGVLIQVSATVNYFYLGQCCHRESCLSQNVFVICLLATLDSEAKTISFHI